jgi:acetyl-CoA/propionyl-CoA carboxylase biotin carboxyl carrier protein
MESVAVYSDADVDAMHVRMADRAVRLGPAAPDESYLRIEAIVDAIRSERADAVHPGYGFLAERAAFARAVEESGATFVGPPSGTIDALGDKLHARRTARAVGVPSVPGTLEPAPVDRADGVAGIVTQAREIGFPLLVKAAAGGGGRGMRRVVREEDLPAALASGSFEAASAFGDGSVYLEREIRPARHIEVQLLGDADGQVVAIGERDCSLQRRHQKLVEEAPAPGLTVDERRAIHEMAVRLGSAAGLRNAATAEFLRAADGSFHFLEVNTRLQVEHGVTELVSGLDIVREQFWLASGAPLSSAARLAADQASRPAGHAIEIRIAAEDPGRQFAPSPGRVGRWQMPSGPGVRVDTAIEAGGSVPAAYDNLIAKVMVHAGDRDAAIDRLARAIDETEIGGLQTTLPFHAHVVRDPTFRAGELSTDWVEERWDGAAAFREAARLAQIAAALATAGQASLSDPAATGAKAAGLTSRSDGASDRGLRGNLPTGDPRPDGTAWRRDGRQTGVDRWPG